MSHHPSASRRGPFRPGDRVQLTDPKGRKYTISLTRDGHFQSTRGSFRHAELIGAEEGTVLQTEDGRRFRGWDRGPSRFRCWRRSDRKGASSPASAAPSSPR